MYLDWMWYCVFLTDGVALSIFSLSLALDGADISHILLGWSLV